ncbi:SIMPL domain-containing protein [Marinifilum sp. RC60d5]|uniref:SIMPL domain-containing protein n=1 Tax=Marinifilum sp. RC60d5 TaxID=3458414 RepID=UPI00403717EE
MKKTVFVFLFVCMCTGFLSAQLLPAKLHVKGESKIFQMPDILNISITISNKNLEYTDCIEDNFEAVNKLKKALKIAAIESLEIHDIGQRVNEEKTYSGGKSVSDGFRASYNIKLQLNSKAKIIHECLEVLKISGVNMNYQAAYGLSPELIKSIEHKLIEEAVADAKIKAEVIAETSENKLLQITNINYGVSGFVSGPKQYMTEIRTAKIGRTNNQSFMNPDPIELSDSVEITYAIVPN